MGLLNFDQSLNVSETHASLHKQTSSTNTTGSIERHVAYLVFISCMLQLCIFEAEKSFNIECSYLGSELG
jgi:hypothetical protein